MKQSHFISLRSEDWESYETLLNTLENRKLRRPEVDAPEFVDLYRLIARDLTIARSRNYSNDLIQRINALTLRGHNLIYANKVGRISRILTFVVSGFPQLVRKHKLFVYMSLFLFLTAALAGSSLVLVSEQHLYSILSPDQVHAAERSWDPNVRLADGTRRADQNLRMFGFYVMNNVSIGLRTIVLGITFGIGTIFILMFNGAFLAAVITHLVLNGYDALLLPFIAGHGSFELTAIVLAGAAGLKLAQSLVAPGELSRKASLRQGGIDVAYLTCGIVIMFVIAAFIEAYWSSLPIDPLVKFIVGLLLWLLLISYFVLGGRRAI